MHWMTMRARRALAVVLMTLALLGLTLAPAAAREICAENAGLAIADLNGDGVVTIGELQALANSAGDSDAGNQLSAIIAQIPGDVTGIRYRDCSNIGGGSGTGDEGGGGSGTGNEGGGDTGTGTEDGGTGSDGSADRPVVDPGTEGAGGSTVFSPAAPIMTSADGEALYIFFLPAVGHGEPDRSTTIALVPVLLGLATAGALAGFRTPRSGPALASRGPRRAG